MRSPHAYQSKYECVKIYISSSFESIGCRTARDTRFVFLKVLKVAQTPKILPRELQFDHFWPLIGIFHRSRISSKNSTLNNFLIFTLPTYHLCLSRHIYNQFTALIKNIRNHTFILSLHRTHSGCGGCCSTNDVIRSYHPLSLPVSAAQYVRCSDTTIHI